MFLELILNMTKSSENFDYPFAPSKIEIKREMLSAYQLEIVDLQNIPIGNVKQLVPNFLD